MIKTVVQPSKEGSANEILLSKQREIIQSNIKKIALQEEEIAKKEELRHEVLELRKQREELLEDIDDFREQINSLLNQCKGFEEKIYFSNIAVQERSTELDKIISDINRSMIEFSSVCEALNSKTDELTRLDKNLEEKKSEFDALTRVMEASVYAHTETIERKKEDIRKLEEEKEMLANENYAMRLKTTEVEEAHNRTIIEKDAEILKKDKFIENQVSTIDNLFSMRDSAQREHDEFILKTKTVVEDMKKRSEDLDKREKLVLEKERNIESLKNKAMIEIGKKAKLEKVRIGKEFVIGLISEDTIIE